MRVALWVVLMSVPGCTGVVATLTPFDGGAVVAFDAGAESAADASAQPPADAGADAGQAVALPAWLRGVPLNKWVEISGTVLAGSPGAPGEDPGDLYAQSNRAIGAYSGMTLRPDTSEIFVAAAGGHSDSSDNAVRSLGLAVDAPAWQLRSAASAVADRRPDVAYYLDGKPTSRHTYWSTQWSSTRGRVMLHRTRFSYGSAVSFDDSNGFNPATNTWDPDNMWADGHTAQARDGDDAVWAMSRSSLFKWSPATDTWAMTGNFGGDEFPQGPLAFDSARRQLFALAWADGQGYGQAAINAWRVIADGTVREAITFTPGAALTLFTEAKPAYAALEYDPDHDRFLFFAAQQGAMDQLFVITPNATTTWSMSLLQLDPTGVVPVSAGGGGLMNKFQYVPSLHGFVMLTSAVNPVYFLRTF